MCGEADRALTTVTELPDRSGASLAELDGLLGRGLLRMWVDDLAGAERDLAGILACQDRSAPLQLLATSLLGQAEYRLGRWDDALQHASLAISLAEYADQAWLAPLGHALTGLVAAARGHWDRATAHVDAALDGGPCAGYLTALTCTAGAHLAAARGDAKEVVIALRPLLERGSPDGCDEPGLVPWQDLLVDALISLGEHDQAEAILLRFERLAAARERHSAMALAARARGNLRAASHDHVGAAAAFEAGLEHAAQVTMPFERARLQLAYGASLRRASKRMRAAEQLEAARATLAQLGARPYLERCERELATCGRTSPARRLDPIGLTTQERAVARLAASGLTNRQVAQELAISVKTVEYHLGHVYAKLQVTSRTQLAHRLDQD
jgi:ATP/maltotriose-dependent transcriptional regulator MalT